MNAFDNRSDLTPEQKQRNEARAEVLTLGPMIEAAEEAGDDIRADQLRSRRAAAYAVLNMPPEGPPPAPIGAYAGPSPEHTAAAEALTRALNPTYGSAQERAEVRRQHELAARPVNPQGPPWVDPYSDIGDENRLRLSYCLRHLGHGFVRAAELKSGLPLWQLYSIAGIHNVETDRHIRAQDVDGYLLGAIVASVRGRAMNMAAAWAANRSEGPFDIEQERARYLGWKPPQAPPQRHPLPWEIRRMVAQELAGPPDPNTERK
jgi:hypothetical protein